MIDNRFDIQTKVSANTHADYMHVQDYLFADFIIKVIKPDSYLTVKDASLALQKEQKLHIKFEGHPNLLKSFGSTTKGLYQGEEREGNIFYSIYEYCRMNTLKRYVSVKGPLCYDIAMRVFIQLCDGLKFVHDKEYVHLHLSLDNICLDHNLDAKLAEIEQVQQCDPCDPVVERKTGIYPYKSPEMDESYDDLYDSFAADVFSLAICVFEMLTGYLPVESKLIDAFFSYDLCEEIETDDLMDEDLIEKPGLDHIPLNLKNLLCKMTSNEPLNRPTLEEILMMDFIKRHPL